MRLTVILLLLLAPVLAAQAYTVTEVGNDYANRAYMLNMVYGNPLHFGEFKDTTTGAPDTDNGVATNVPLLCSFTFFGQAYTHCNVSTNGFISFGALSSSHPAAQAALPDSAAPNNFVAALWKDLGVNPLTANGQSVLYGTSSGGGAGDFAFHVMWQSWPDKGGSGIGAENNVIITLYEATGAIEIHYGAPAPYGVSQAYGFACGIENAAGTEGLAAPPGWMGVNQQGKAYRFEPVVAPPPAFQIDTADPLPDGTAGVAYAFTFTASGGQPGYMWYPAAAVGLPLPAGWSLDTSGNLSAAASDMLAGTYTFDITVYDSVLDFTARRFTVTIHPAGGGGGGGPTPGVGGGSGGGGCAAAPANLIPACFGLLLLLRRRRK